jgi:hypothetical protein
MNDRNLWFIWVVFLTVVFGCNPQDTYRDKVNQQDDANAQAKAQDLALAKGTYTGTMHLNASAQNFDTVVQVSLSPEITRNSQNPNDQSETVETPKLQGSLNFPVLTGLDISDLATYSALTGPMGGYLTVTFDFGDYNPRTQQLILPYTVTGYSQGSLGELNGTLSNGLFHGTWFSKPLGDVGIFDLTQDSTPSSGTN